MPVPRISKEELKQQLDADPASVAIVDARLKYAYEHSTVTLPGSIRLAPGSNDFSLIPRDRLAVVYDSDPNEVTASDVAGTLLRQGRRARVLQGGIAAWVGANLPVESKPAPKPAAPAKG